MRQSLKHIIAIALLLAMSLSGLVFVSTASAESLVCYSLITEFTGVLDGAVAYSAMYDGAKPVAYDVIHLDPGETKTVSLYAFVSPGGFTGVSGISGGTINSFIPGIVGDAKCAAAGAAAGPDMVPIPSDAAMGTFTTTTALYAAPNADAATSYMMDSGQSLWVFGLDPSGAFYQVMLSGQTYWVPVGSLGPTFSPPWDGAPLPTTVIATTG
jgi:hypothetical protein